MFNKKNENKDTRVDRGASSTLNATKGLKCPNELVIVKVKRCS